MHIAIDARVINSTTGRYIERLLTYLERLDSPHQFSVIVRAKDKDYWKPRKDNFRVVVADYHQYTLSEQVRFYIFLKNLNADLVHFCMPQQPLLYRGKSITTVHDLNLLRIKENDGMSKRTLRFKQRVFRRLLRKVVRRSAFVITPTQYVKEDLLKFQSIPPYKVVVTHEAADLVAKKAEPVSKFVGKKFIIVVGRAETYKNQKGAIIAHHKVRKTHPDVHLVIIGKRDRTSRELEEWAYAKGYRNVDFFGFATDAQLAWFYNHCLAYVFPSFMEGFGLPALEAMKHKAPVASSNATCMPEVLGNAALYFNPSRPLDISKKINQILDNTRIRNELIRRGTLQAKKYSWKRMAEQTLATYNNALDKSKG